MDAAIAAQIISLSLCKQLVLNLHWSRSDSGKLYWYHLCWHTSTSLETLPGYPQIGAFGPRGERPAAPGVPRGALGLWGGPAPAHTPLGAPCHPKYWHSPEITASSPNQILLLHTVTFISPLLKALWFPHGTPQFTFLHSFIFPIRDTDMLETNRDYACPF